jgi:alpha-ketoglutarate-dependent taurine dioxygenase
MIEQQTKPPAARTLPFAIEAGPGAKPDALIETARNCRAAWSDQLLDHGALLLRSWDLAGIDRFRAFVAAFSGSSEAFGYAGGASPRRAIDSESGVYNSTDYPAAMTLPLHNELSYAGHYPARLFFFCRVAPLSGGATTLGDSRRILEGLDRQVLDEFRARQIRYVRNLSPEIGSGYSWQEAFETEDPRSAEARCAELGAAFEWDDGFLRISQIRPATARHPDTGEEVWFNQADGFHPSVLDPETYEAAMAFAGSEDRFRLNVFYGDGSRIEQAALDHVRAVIRSETIPHAWQTGDILVLDNLLAAHGREPFSGPREIVLAMT